MEKQLQMPPSQSSRVLRATPLVIQLASAPKPTGRRVASTAGLIDSHAHCTASLLGHKSECERSKAKADEEFMLDGERVEFNVTVALFNVTFVLSAFQLS